MDYQELLDRITRRVARADSAPSLTTARFNPELRERAEFWASKSPELKKALDKIRASELRLKKARMAGLSAKDLEQIKSSELGKLVADLQTNHASKLRTVGDQLITTIKKHEEIADADATRSLLELERAKLRFHDYSEREAMGRVNVLRNRGAYDDAELTVLASKGRKARAAADDLRRDLPPALANDHGRDLLQKAEALLSRKPGEIEYVVEGADVASRVSLLELFNPGAVPTASEFQSATL